MLVLIGPQWLTATDSRGRLRLQDQDDLVRLEIEAALERQIRVIPVLIDEAELPARDEVPETLAKLLRRNAARLRHESFRADVQRLVNVVERILEEDSS
jgi:hypothetical protein